MRFLRLALVFLSVGCLSTGVDKSLNWKVISINGVERGMVPNIINTINDSIILMAGTNISSLPTTEWNTVQSKLYKSIDGVLTGILP